MPAYPGVNIASANTDTDVLTNAGSDDLTVNINMLNRNAATAKVRLHVVVAAGSASAANAIEWDRAVAAGGVLERWAVTIGAGQKIVARSDLTNVNIVCWGA